MTRIRNDLQYEMERWWLEELERALERLMAAPPDFTGVEPKLALRLQDFEQQRMVALRREIKSLRTELQDYERSQPLKL